MTIVFQYWQDPVRIWQEMTNYAKAQVKAALNNRELCSTVEPLTGGQSCLHLHRRLTVFTELNVDNIRIFVRHPM